MGNVEEAAVQIKNVKKKFKLDGKEIEVLENVTLDIKKGEFISIVGSSGCGKSTLLRMIAGLETTTEGEIMVGERVVDNPSLDVGMVFQESRLFPWMKTSENIRYGLTPEQKKTLSKTEQQEKIDRLIELVGLQGFENAWPRQLSGGMQQRASIARSLIANPDVLLLDEPFGALDAFNRINMQMEIIRIWEKEKKTMIMVTHDIDEAIFLADRVVVMSDKPGIVKEIFNVNLSRQRDRTSDDFSGLRKKIYSQFFESIDESIDYYI